MAIISRPSIPEVIFERVKTDLTEFAFNFFEDGISLDVSARTYKIRLKASGIVALDKASAANADGRVTFTLSDAEKTSLTGSEYQFFLVEILVGGGEKTLMAGTLRWSVPFGKPTGLVSAPDVSVNYITATQELMVALGVVDFGSMSSAVSAAQAEAAKEIVIQAQTDILEIQDEVEQSQLAVATDRTAVEAKALAVDQAKNEVDAGLLAVQQLVAMGFRPKGNWNVATNTPNLSAVTKADGDAYVVKGPGTTSITGTAINAVDGDVFQWNAADSVWVYRPAATVAADESVNDSKLALSIKTKNYPFRPESTPGMISRAAIREVTIQSNVVTASKKLTLGVIRRNVTVNSVPNTWQLLIFDYTAGTFGDVLFSWSATNYVPATNVERLPLTASSVAPGSAAYVTIDWSQVPDLTDVQAQAFAANGLSDLVFKPVSSLLADGSVGDKQLSNQLLFKNFPFAPTTVADNTPAVTIRNAVKNIVIRGGTIPGDKVVCMGVLRRNVTVNSVANTWQIRFYDYTAGSFGAILFDWTQVNYTPTATKERLAITGTDYAAGCTLFIDIDWGQVPNATDYSGVTAARTQLSQMVFLPPATPIPNASVVSSMLASASVDNTKLTPEVLFKNYPFAPSTVADVAGAITIRNAVRNITILGSVPADKVICLGIMRRNVTVNSVPNTWNIRFYDYTTGAFGTTLYDWNQVGYTAPAGNIERLTIPGIAGTFAEGTTLYLEIDWSKVPNLTDISGITAARTQLSPLVFAPLTTISGMSYKNFPFEATSTPGAIEKAAILDMRIEGPYDKNTKLTVGVLRRNVTVNSVPNTWQISVFNYTTGAFGNVIFNWQTTNYVPSADIETLYIASNPATELPGLKLTLTIDWTKVPNLTAISGRTYAQNGISNLAIRDAEPVNFVSMPPVLRILTGSQYWGYDDAVIWNSPLFEKRNYRLDITAKNVASPFAAVTPYSYYPGIFKLNPHTEAYNATFSIQDNSDQRLTDRQASRSIHKKTVRVETYAKPTGVNKNVIVFADSYFDGKNGQGIYEHMMTLAVADGNTITFKGTRTSHGVASEARSSWTEYYLTDRYIPTATRANVNAPGTDPNLTSPLLFSTDDTAANKYLSFSEYMTTNAIGPVDQVVFFLGMNYGEGTSINNIISSIKAYNAGIKVIVCTVPGAEKSKKINPTNLNTETRQLLRLWQNDQYYTKFQGREAEGIYLCPTHLGFHRLYHLINVAQEQVQFNLNAIPTEIVNSDHHPNDSGEKSLAYMIYNYVMSI